MYSREITEREESKMKWHSFKIENWRGKLLWILHPFDTYEKHTERYYNLKSVQKVIKRVYEKERKEK